MTYGEICPFDQAQRFLCRYRECTVQCSWRYCVEGRGGKPVQEPVEKVEISVVVHVKAGQATLDVWT